MAALSAREGDSIIGDLGVCHHKREVRSGGPIKSNLPHVSLVKISLFSLFILDAFYFFLSSLVAFCFIAVWVAESRLAGLLRSNEGFEGKKVWQPLEAPLKCWSANTGRHRTTASNSLKTISCSRCLKTSNWNGNEQMLLVQQPPILLQMGQVHIVHCNDSKRSETHSNPWILFGWYLIGGRLRECH